MDRVYSGKMSSVLNIVKPKTAVEKKTRTTVDTIEVTPERIGKWKLPTGQRPLKENHKVRQVAEQIKVDGGVIPGVLTLGVMNGETYIIDGQHRLRAYLITGLLKGYSDVRYLHAETMAEINMEFVQLNSRLVSMRPDDLLRGLEESIEGLGRIRKLCPFVGYDQIRRGNLAAPVASMSTMLRCWRGSSGDMPNQSTSGVSTQELAEGLIDEDVRNMTDFLLLANEAFGRNPEYARLWGALNMTLCMWMYKNLVLKQYSLKSPRLSKDTFRKCLMSVSANSTYQDWLLGRNMGERDRSPAYGKLKAIFAERLRVETGKAVMLPAPAWASK